MAEKLSRLEIASVQDLLFHLPIRYEDRTNIKKISQLTPGKSAQVQGKVISCDITFGKKRALVCRIQDETGVLDLRFFYFSSAQKNRLQPGVELLCFGDVTIGRGALSIIHPETQVIPTGSKAQLSDRLTPVYPMTEGVKQATLRRLTDHALKQLNFLPD